MTLRNLPWYICSALAVAVLILLHLYGVRGRTIAHMERSIEHGKDIAAAYLHTDSIQRGIIDLERRRADSLQAEYARLRAIPVNRPIPRRPVLNNDLKDAIMDGVNTK